MSRPINILATGLDLDFAARMNPNMDLAGLRNTLERSMALLDRVPNLSRHLFWLDPTALPQSEKSIASFKKLVTGGPPQGGRWDGQLLAHGMRTIPQMTTLFEELVNTVATASESKAKFLFPAALDDHWETVKRNFPELGMGEKPSM